MHGRIVYKSSRDLERMRRAGSIVSEVLAALRDAVRPGISTTDLDRLARGIMSRRGGKPSFLGYRRFPAAICASLNDEVVHGIPSPKRLLTEGDVVKLDVGVIWQGMHADSAISVPVGEVSEAACRLLEVTREALWAGIRAVTRTGHVQDISRAVQQCVEARGMALVRDMFGHGVGKSLHEYPPVPNYLNEKLPNPALLPGMTLAVEPMVNLGGGEVEILRDRWTVRTRDRSLSAHFEHTLAVTQNGFEVLTLGPHDSAP